MDLDRFKALAEAYGGDLRRWPEAARADAKRFAADRPEARALLAEEADFDHLLHGWSPEPASAALRQRVIASAAVRRARLGLKLSWKLLASGAGMAAAGAAGAMAGAIWIAAAAGDLRTESLLAAAAPEDGAAVTGWLIEGDT
jgi:hypothetical protein